MDDRIYIIGLKILFIYISLIYSGPIFFLFSIPVFIYYYLFFSFNINEIERRPAKTLLIQYLNRQRNDFGTRIIVLFIRHPVEIDRTSTSGQIMYKKTKKKKIKNNINVRRVVSSVPFPESIVAALWQSVTLSRLAAAMY